MTKIEEQPFLEAQERRCRRWGRALAGVGMLSMLLLTLSICSGLDLIASVLNRIMPGTGAWGVVLAPVSPALLFYACIYFSREKTAHANAIQRELGRLKALNDERPPFLLLRRFDEAGLAFTPARQVARGVVSGRSYLPELASALLDHGTVLAIGGPTGVSDFFSVSNVLFFQSSDHNWEDAFDIAAEGARAILIIPGTSPGVVREVAALEARGYLPKTLVFMPPTPTTHWIGNRLGSPEDVAKKWEAMRAFWQTRNGYEFPPYDPHGALFRVGHQYQETIRARLDPDCASDTLTQAVATLLPEPTAAMRAASVVIPALEQWEVPLPHPHWIAQLYVPG